MANDAETQRAMVRNTCLDLKIVFCLTIKIFLKNKSRAGKIVDKMKKHVIVKRVWNLFNFLFSSMWKGVLQTMLVAHRCKRYIQVL